MESIKVLKAISNSTKLRIINLLIENELCVCELEEVLKLKQVNISKNLINLRKAGVVDVRREKQRGFYFLTKDFLDNIMLIIHIKQLREKEEILISDFSNFLIHEDVKDGSIYVCNAYKNEVKQDDKENIKS